MALRAKIYYSENQITRNLFANEKEFMTLESWEEYIGFYHRYTTGEVFSEPDWDPVRSKRLIRYKDRTETYFRYLDLKQFTVVKGEKKKIMQGGSHQLYKYKAPRAVRRVINDSELKDGKMRRFFISKRNEPNRVFFEIDSSQTAGYGSDEMGINKYLYELIEVPWKIVGPEYDVFNKDGLLIKPGVVDTNLRIVERYSIKSRILPTLLNNPREFSIYDV